MFRRRQQKREERLRRIEAALADARVALGIPLPLPAIEQETVSEEVEASPSAPRDITEQPLQGAEQATTASSSYPVIAIDNQAPFFTGLLHQRMPSPAPTPKPSPSHATTAAAVISAPNFSSSSKTQTTSPLQLEPVAISWDSLPPMLRPASGELSHGRSLRKQQQLASILSIACSILPHAVSSPRHGDFPASDATSSTTLSSPTRLKLVDFGAGSGHLGLTIAYLYPHIDVVLVERKEYSTRVARDRIAGLAISNCSIYCGDIHDYTDPFDIAVSLHSCGILTDLILSLCATYNAQCCLVPCCYGQLGATIRQPQSNYLCCQWPSHAPSTTHTSAAHHDDSCVAEGEKSNSSGSCRTTPKDHKGDEGEETLPCCCSFGDAVSAADYTVKAGDWRGFTTGNSFIYAKSCMMIVDIDRCLLLHEKELLQQSPSSAHSNLQQATVSPPDTPPRSPHSPSPSPSQSQSSSPTTTTNTATNTNTTTASQQEDGSQARLSLEEPPPPLPRRHTWIHTLHPPTCSPKNNVIVSTFL